MDPTRLGRVHANNRHHNAMLYALLVPYWRLLSVLAVVVRACIVSVCLTKHAYPAGSGWYP